jgi:hypothetical protein
MRERDESISQAFIRIRRRVEKGNYINLTAIYSNFTNVKLHLLEHHTSGYIISAAGPHTNCHHVTPSNNTRRPLADYASNVKFSRCDLSVAKG